MMYECTRQRSGPLVREARSLRPRRHRSDAPWVRREKNALHRAGYSAVCRTPSDRLELRLALFGFEGAFYTLTFDPARLPRTFPEVRSRLRAFRERLRRWRGGVPYDWIYAIEGRHGEGRYHVHMVLRSSDFPPDRIQSLWHYGGVDREPLLAKTGGYRRIAEYLNKERPDGVTLPLGRHPWSCARTLKLSPPERWRDPSGRIPIPDNVLWSRRGQTENDFGAVYYAEYILSPCTPPAPAL